MLRFIKHNLTGIHGVEIFPMLSLLIFVLFFIIVLMRVIRMNRSEVNELSAIPLQDESLNEAILTPENKKA